MQQILHVTARVVVPVVAAMLADENVGELSLRMLQDGLLLTLEAEGERFQCYLSTEGAAPRSEGEMREGLAADLQDFIAESRFGWGQLRNYTAQ